MCLRWHRLVLSKSETLLLSKWHGFFVVVFLTIEIGRLTYVCFSWPSFVLHEWGFFNLLNSSMHQASGRLFWSLSNRSVAGWTLEDQQRLGRWIESLLNASGMHSSVKSISPFFPVWRAQNNRTIPSPWPTGLLIGLDKFLDHLHELNNNDNNNDTGDCYRA